MPTSKNIGTLIINKVENQAVYDYMVANNLVNADELYCVQGDAEVNIVVDSNLSTTSENPVQNKVVTEAINNLNNLVGDISISDQINTALTSLNYAGSSSVGGAAQVSESDKGIVTEGDGTAYTVNIPGITSLTAGVSFVMVPNVVSATDAPTLNVNNLGAKYIRRRLSNLVTAAQTGYAANWLVADIPYRVTYDGDQWMVEGLTKPASADLYGTVPVAKGGTGADNTADALTNLGAASATDLTSHINDTSLHFGINPTANVDGTLYRGTTTPTGTTKLNYSGYFEATRVYGSYYSDYAEYFNVLDDTPMPGVAIEICGENAFKVCTHEKSALAVGVISDDYYMCIGHRPNLANVPVALAGKVTVQVTGVVEPGDMLVASGINGTLRSLAQGEDAPYGAILGQALTREHDGKVLMMVFRR